MTQQRRYEVIVAGLGAMGSATLFHLARRGVRTLGLERFRAGHGLGSSHGDSRIIRETYFEHPLYVPLVQRAHELWVELEKVSGESLMRIVGGLMIGPEDGMVVSGTLRSVREHDLPHEILDANEVRARYPAFRPGRDLVAVLDPRAGFLDPEACTRAHLAGAVAAGAEARFEEPVLDWAPDGDEIRAETAGGKYHCQHLVLTGGAWNSALAGGVELPLTIERQTVFWFERPPAATYAPGNFPIYAYEFKPGTICYGFPELARGIKASVMHDGLTVSSADQVERKVGDDEIEPLRAALQPILPELASAHVRGSDVCLFTNTPDHDFIIDFHPDYPQVLVSSPCSGHGFKFASAIGELQADLVTSGKARFDLSPFRLDRPSLR